MLCSRTDVQNLLTLGVRLFQTSHVHGVASGATRSGAPPFTIPVNGLEILGIALSRDDVTLAVVKGSTVDFYDIIDVLARVCSVKSVVVDTHGFSHGLLGFALFHCAEDDRSVRINFRPWRHSGLKME